MYAYCDGAGARVRCWVTLLPSAHAAAATRLLAKSGVGNAAGRQWLLPRQGTPNLVRA